MAFNAAAALEAEVFAATYVVEIHGVSYTLPVRYQEPVLIGGGTFGQVIGAVDTMTGESVAVKKLTRWNHSVDDCKRAFREIKLLRLLNIEGLCADLLRIIHVYSPQHTIEEFQDIFFVCERAPSNLHEILHTNPLSIDHVRLMMYQLLRGLHYLASANILHRDLKPSNIAVFEDCSIRILDFGLARPLNVVNPRNTEYVQTRWYRAPEVVVGAAYGAP
eukprot:m.463114 g.463114  ORF g.463114 m.463114 type:complete len:219 (-) comp57030_c0_seq1:679-1335(-)